MIKLLINESPLMVLPTLVQKIGLNEAIVLQQLHYLINPEFNQNLWKERYWVYNTYEEWQKRFKFWSVPTVKRIFLKLENMGLVVSCERTYGGFRKKWYTVDYDALSYLEIEHPDQVRTVEPASGSSPDSEPDQNKTILYIQKNTKQKIKKKNKKKKFSACEIAIPRIAISEELNKVKQKEELESTNQRFDKRFESFWQKYPRRVAKAAALRSLQGALKKTSLRAILEAIEGQMREREECSRVGIWLPPWKHPATWLNQECWDDIVRTPDEINQEAQAHWKSKMSYRDAGNLQSSLERDARHLRIKAWQESAKAKREEIEGRAK